MHRTGVARCLLAAVLFGASAPAGDLYKYFNITTEAVVEAAKAL